MDATENNGVVSDANVGNEIASNVRSAEMETLVRELTDMGFAESSVLQIVNNAGDVPKALIVEQLLTSNPETDEPIPLVDDDGDRQWIDVNSVAYKMVIAINTGLNMSTGKTASQAAHAALGLYELIIKRKNLRPELKAWKDQGCRKIVVQVQDSAQLIKVCLAGKMHKVLYDHVQDAGRTEVARGSLTAAAFFGTDEELKPVTGKLRLLN